MTIKAVSLSTLGVCVLMSVQPSLAHHSFAAQFDAEQRVTLTGPVTKVEWMNPHIHFYVNITDEATEEVTEYAFEMGSPNTLIRLGWTRNSLGPGDVVTVDGTLARDGSPLVNATSVVLTKTGRKMFAGSSQESTP